MAWYDAHKNRGYNNKYGIIEPGYGGRAAVVGYSATEERYVATSEQVVQYGRYPATHQSPPTELYRVHGGGSNPLLRTWAVTHDGPKKDRKSSPKFSQTKGPHRDDSPPRYNNYSSSDDEDEEDVICENGFCYPKPEHTKGKDRGHNGKHYGPGNYTVPHSSTQPKNDQYHVTSYPDHYNDQRNKGNGYNPPSYTVPVATQPTRDPHPNHYNDQKNKGNGYNPNPPSYTAPVTTQPTKAPHYETSYPNHYSDQRNKGNGHNPPSYTAPGTAQPRQDPPFVPQNNRFMLVNPPRPVKTSPEAKGVENMKNSPVSSGAQRSPVTPSSPASVGSHGSPFTSSPRKEHRYQETIDSTEARRRYGGVSSGGAGAQPTQNYTGTIDCKEAAKRYNGVFVPK